MALCRLIAVITFATTLCTDALYICLTTLFIGAFVSRRICNEPVAAVMKWSEEETNTYDG
jgi:hypothetical protein